MENEIEINGKKYLKIELPTEIKEFSIYNPLEGSFSLKRMKIRRQELETVKEFELIDSNKSSLSKIEQGVVIDKFKKLYKEI